MSTDPSIGAEAGAAATVEANGPADSSTRGLFRAPQGHLKRLEWLLERGLGLEHGANIFPLIHIFCYYLDLVLLGSGWISSPWLVVPLWVVLLLLNYSLSIGVLHLHAHRRLFTRRLPNRIVEALLAVPCGITYPAMLIVHVYLHHHYEDGEGDPTSTRGYEKGLRAVWYWIRYPYIVQKTTIATLFGRNAAPAWKRLRWQYLIDTSYFFVIALVYGILDLKGMLLFYALPIFIVFLNIGFFAWLTHAPADHGSLSTTNNWMNLFVHNQGYHAVHHKYPSLHWTRLPDRLDMMTSVDDELIVPYWVTLENALRILRPRSFRDGQHGKIWKERYVKRAASGRLRLFWLPYFGWI